MSSLSINLCGSSDYKEISAACGKRVINTKLWTDNLKGRTTWDEYVIGKNDIIKMDFTAMNNVTRDKEQRQVLVNTVGKFGFQQEACLLFS
jgi:hypothetical protein